MNEFISKFDTKTHFQSFSIASMYNKKKKSIYMGKDVFGLSVFFYCFLVLVSFTTLLVFYVVGDFQSFSIASEKVINEAIQVYNRWEKYVNFQSFSIASH